MTFISWLNRRCNRNSLDRQAQQRYQQIRFYFSCRLDRKAEVEEMTRATFRVAAPAIDHQPLHRIDGFLLSVAENLLRHRWWGGGCCGKFCTSDSCSQELEDQAAALYIKLRALRRNPAAGTEISTAIHQWIGRDACRRAAYHRARDVLYRKTGPQTALKTSHRTAPETADSGFLPHSGLLDGPPSLGWTDVMLLLLAFLLLLPMIGFLAMPAGGG